MEVSCDFKKRVSIYGKKKEWNELEIEKTTTTKDVDQERKCVENIFENLSNREWNDN